MSALTMIEKLGHLTSFRDRESMESHLVDILLELTPSYINSLYTVRSITPDVNVRLITRSQQPGVTSSDMEGNTLSPQLVRAMGDALVTGDEQILHCQERGITTFIVPVVSIGLDETLVLVQQTVNARSDQGALIKGLLKVYGNFLVLFYEQARDKLTGLLNRATLNQHLDRLIDNQHRHEGKRLRDGFQQWLGVLDIDHFKLINDRYGHLYGDEILILVSRLMEDNFRDEDLCFRYGGEEFIVLVQVESAEQARLAFERFRIAIAHYAFPQVGSVSISIGMIRIDGQMDPAAVIGNADKALYFSKGNGRNQTHSYEELVANGQLVEERVDSPDVDFF